MSTTPAGWIGRRRRTILEIMNDLDALSGAQSLAIWNDLTAGLPPKVATCPGVNAAAIWTMHFVATGIGGLTATEKNEGRQRTIAFWVQDDPQYLVNPPFAPEIDVPGDAPV